MNFLLLSMSLFAGGQLILDSSVSYMHLLCHIIIETVPYVIIPIHNNVWMAEWSEAHCLGCLTIAVV